MTEHDWDCIGPYITELILSYLPIPSIIVASSVCRSWNSIIRSNSFKTRVSHSEKLPWFFLSAQYTNFPNENKLFAFIPESDNWIELPNTTLLSNHPFTASMDRHRPFGGDGKDIMQHVLINRAYLSQTGPPPTSARNPLFGSSDQLHRSRQDMAITVGGIDLVDIRGSLAVDLPDIFKQGCSLSSSLFKGKLYVFHVCLNWISSFDLEKLLWSDVKTLSPPGVVLSFLVSCGDRLILAGLCCDYCDEFEFNIWRIGEETLEFSEVGIMPGELLSRFLDGVEDKSLPRLKCVGFSNLVYVFGERSIACVCEISNWGKCKWRMVPNMPECVHYDVVISFSCDVSLHDFLGNGKSYLDS